MEQESTMKTKNEDEKFCLECGEVIKAKAEICPKCGVRQIFEQSASPTSMPLQPPKSKTVATFLALLLGGIGAHKFYLNRPGQAVFYIIFALTLFPAVVGFIEGLYYAFLPEEEFNRKYNPQYFVDEEECYEYDDSGNADFFPKVNTTVRNVILIIIFILIADYFV